MKEEERCDFLLFSFASCSIFHHLIHLPFFVGADCLVAVFKMVVVVEGLVMVDVVVVVMVAMMGMFGLSGTVNGGKLIVIVFVQACARDGGGDGGGGEEEVL